MDTIDRQARILDSDDNPTDQTFTFQLTNHINERMHHEIPVDIPFLFEDGDHWCLFMINMVGFDFQARLIKRFNPGVNPEAPDIKIIFLHAILNNGLGSYNEDEDQIRRSLLINMVDCFDIPIDYQSLRQLDFGGAPGPVVAPQPKITLIDLILRLINFYRDKPDKIEKLKTNSTHVLTQIKTIPSIRGNTKVQRNLDAIIEDINKLEPSLTGELKYTKRSKKRKTKRKTKKRRSNQRKKKRRFKRRITKKRSSRRISKKRRTKRRMV